LNKTKSWIVFFVALISVGISKKTNRGSENDSISKKSLKFNLICFDIPASNCFICLVCNFHIVNAGSDSRIQTGRKHILDTKKIRDNSQMGYPLKKGRDEKNENIFVAKGFF